jgi:acetyltransferase-like isoleucine patch superfamily enzyme
LERPILDNKDIVFGCVADNKPKYFSQALRLVQSWNWFGGGAERSDFIVCAVNKIDPFYKKQFDKYGAKVRVVQPYNKKHPFSNKLRFLQLEEVKNYKLSVLLDCDTIFVQDPAPYLSMDKFQAKIADKPTVPHELFQKVFNFFGLEIPGQNFKCTTGEQTIPYFNAGVLAFTKQNLEVLLPQWINFNDKIIENLEILEDRTMFAEQASLSLAIASTNTGFSTLAQDMNFPPSLREPCLENVDPAIIHYHDMVEPSGHLQNGCPYPLIQKRIADFNRRLTEELAGEHVVKGWLSSRYKKISIKKKKEFYEYLYRKNLLLSTIKAKLRYWGILKVGKKSRIGKGLLIWPFWRENQDSIIRLRLGNGVTLGNFTHIQGFGGVVEIGNNTCCGSYCILACYKKLQIGQNVLIADCVTMRDSNHIYEDTTIPIKKQGMSSANIIIEDDVWVGHGATILKGVRVGKGAVVAAGAIVTSDVPPMAVVAGVPARVLKFRGMA